MRSRFRTVRLSPWMLAGKIDPDDIVVLFIGSNDRPTAEDAETLIATEKEMIRYLGSSKYIVVGLTSKEMIPEVAAVNEKLAAAFGTHFLDIRSYLLEHGLEEAGIAPTDQDLMDLAGRGDPFEPSRGHCTWYAGFLPDSRGAAL